MIASRTCTGTRLITLIEVRRYPSDMTDVEWAAVRALLPAPAWLEGKGGQPEGYCHGQLLDAIRYLVASGISWRAMPADFPAWGRVHAFFRRWREHGLVTEFHDRLREIGGGHTPMISAMAAAVASDSQILVGSPSDEAVAAFLRHQPLTVLPGIGPRPTNSCARTGSPPSDSSPTLPGCPHPAPQRARGPRTGRPRPPHRPPPGPTRDLVRSTSANRRFARDELGPDAHRRALFALADELGQRRRRHAVREAAYVFNGTVTLAAIRLWLR